MPSWIACFVWYRIVFTKYSAIILYFIMYQILFIYVYFLKCICLAYLFTSGWSNVNCTQTNTFDCTGIAFSSCQHSIWIFPIQFAFRRCAVFIGFCLTSDQRANSQSIDMKIGKLHSQSDICGVGFALQSVDW